MSGYANMISLCSGNFSNPDKLPGEPLILVFIFYEDLVSSYAHFTDIFAMQQKIR